MLMLYLTSTVVQVFERKSQQDKAPLVNIETSQPMELIHLGLPQN